MRLYEFDDKELGNRYNPNADKINTRELGDTRKARLTLRQVNKLKRMRALKDLENAQTEDLIQTMYGEPDEAGAGGGMGGPPGF